MTKAELESKHLADLHALAAEQEIPRYRMLPRAELIEKLAGGEGKAEVSAGGRGRSSAPKRERSRSSSSRPKRERRPKREPEAKAEPEPAAPAPKAAAAAEPAAGEERPRRRRRRRRTPFGRKGGQEVRVPDLLLPPGGGRQVIAYAETREGCTALLSEIAAELEGVSKGPDPVVVLIDPSPEELANWRREAPKAEIVAAGQARHANDALAQARNRAAGGEDVILLVDSLTRLSEAYGDADAAKEFFDAGQGTGGGSLTVVAAVERKPRG
jgi:Rho termination factor-like protein